MTAQRVTTIASLDRSSFATSVCGVVGAALGGVSRPACASGQAPAAAAAARTAGRLAPAKVTRIRLFYRQNYDRNGPQAFSQSNMVVLVDTETRGLPASVRVDHQIRCSNVARSVIGKNPFDTEMIWQAAFMDGFYSPGKERLHALGAVDLAL